MTHGQSATMMNTPHRVQTPEILIFTLKGVTLVHFDQQPNRAFRTSFAELQPSYRHYQALSDNKNSTSLNLHRNLVENILLIIIHRGAISISGTLSIRLRFSTHAAIFYVCEYGSRLDMHSPPTGTTDAPGHPPTPPLATHWPPAHAAMTL